MSGIPVGWKLKQQIGTSGKEKETIWIQLLIGGWLGTSLCLEIEWSTSMILNVSAKITIVEQELLTLPEHLSSPPVFNGVCVTPSLVLCIMFCRLLAIVLSVLQLEIRYDFHSQWLNVLRIYGPWKFFWVISKDIALILRLSLNIFY